MMNRTQNITAIELRRADRSVLPNEMEEDSEWKVVIRRRTEF